MAKISPLNHLTVNVFCATVKLSPPSPNMVRPTTHSQYCCMSLSLSLCVPCHSIHYDETRRDVRLAYVSVKAFSYYHIISYPYSPHYTSFVQSRKATIRLIHTPVDTPVANSMLPRVMSEQKRSDPRRTPVIRSII
jgi:hypothetical protein